MITVAVDAVNRIALAGISNRVAIFVEMLPDNAPVGANHWPPTQYSKITVPDPGLMLIANSLGRQVPESHTRTSLAATSKLVPPPEAVGAEILRFIISYSVAKVDGEHE